MTPRFKVYRGREYIAACKYAEDAAAVVATGGEALTIRDSDHKTVLWDEDHEAQPAGESFDFVAETIHSRRALRFRLVPDAETGGQPPL